MTGFRKAVSMRSMQAGAKDSMVQVKDFVRRPGSNSVL